MSYQDIPGYSGFLWLYEEVLTKNPAARIVEVGVALGHSIAYLEETRRALRGPRGPGYTFAIDPWGGYARNGEQQEALKEGEPGDFTLFIESMLKHSPAALESASVIRATSAEASGMFRPRSLDLVLIDGAHDYDSVREDIMSWLDLVKTGGIISGDDFDPKYPGVEKAVREFFAADDVEVRGTTWVVRL